MAIQLDSRHRQAVILWYLLQHSLSAWQRLFTHFQQLDAILAPSAIKQWESLGIHAQHLKRLQAYHAGELDPALTELLERTERHCDFVLLSDDANYPPQLLVYSDAPPLVFGQGNVQALSHPQVAMVGSRKPSAHGKQISYDFAYYLSQQGFFISSGLAEGIDAAAHEGGLKHQRTVAVVGTGLDLCYPQHHHTLQQRIVAQGGCVISEFLMGSKALQHHFPRRNRIVSGLSVGVIVVEAKQDSGSLITARLAADQGKQVFAIPGHIYSESHKGCHALIREGATLVDHPEQVVQDLALPAQWQSQHSLTAAHSTFSYDETENEAQIPTHLFRLYQVLDWQGQDLDQLALALQQPVAALTAELMELELLGLCMQQSGRYIRCRQRV